VGGISPPLVVSLCSSELSPCPVSGPIYCPQPSRIVRLVKSKMSAIEGILAWPLAPCKFPFGLRQIKRYPVSSEPSPYS